MSQRDNSNDDHVVFMIRFPLAMRKGLDDLARREGENRSVIMRRLLNEALIRSRNGQPILRAS